MTDSKDVRSVMAALTIVKRRHATLSCVLNIIQVHSHRPSRSRNILRPVFSFVANIQGLSNNAFKRMYCMPKHVFFSLSDALNRTRHSVTTKSSSTSPVMRLSLTVRWLAGGSYLDIAHAHGVAFSSFCHDLDRTLKELNRELTIHFPYSDSQWLETESEGFSHNGSSPITGCCAALDGIAIKIQEPTRSDVDNSSTYHNRKGFFAIHVQAACDSKYRFVFVSGLAAGSSHDSTAFVMSRLSELLEYDTEGVLTGFWTAGYNAYVASRRLLTPWPGCRLPKEKDCFNYWLSSTRIHIEQAFGTLVARWGILWRPLRLSVANEARLVLIICKLHN